LDIIIAIALYFKVLSCESDMVPEEAEASPAVGKGSPASKVLDGEQRMHEDAGTICMTIITETTAVVEFESNSLPLYLFMSHQHQSNGLHTFMVIKM
jgi:hypothetical protein